MQRSIRAQSGRTEATAEGEQTPVYYHEHPIKILTYSAKNLWLLIFPLLRSLQFFPFSLQQWIDWGKGAWFDLIIAAVILGFGTLRWWCCRYYFDDNAIHAESGVIVHQTVEIPFDRITASVEEHPIWMRPMHAVRLKFSTATETFSESSISLILYYQDLHEIRPYISVLQNQGGKTETYHTPFWRILLFSALFSSSLSGAIYVAAMFFQGGRIVSDILEEIEARELLEDATERASEAISDIPWLQNIPSIALTIGIVILALWLVSFIANLFRYANFRIRYGDEYLSIHMGIINRRRYHLRDDAIVFPDLRQNLIMKIFGMVSLHIRCPGYGNSRNTLPVVIPLLRKKDSWELLEHFHAVQKPQDPDLRAKPKLRAIWNFIWEPVLCIAAILLCWVVLDELLPTFSSFVNFFAIMLLIPSVWLLIVRMVSLFSEQVCLDENGLWCHFSKGYTFHTISVPQEAIVRMDIRQTPLQKRIGICHLYIVCNGPTQERYKLTALPEAQAREIMKRINRQDIP